MRSPDGKSQRGDDGGKGIGSSGNDEETEDGSTMCSVVVAKNPESIRHEILNTLATNSHARYVCNLMLNDRVTSYVMAGAQTV